jgi:hypothetical protein
VVVSEVAFIFLLLKPKHNRGVLIHPLDPKES